MWDYDSLIRKSHTYFTRAREHPLADDDEFSLWLLLGLEFLLRAPLAKISTTLLAEPSDDSILHAAGFPGNTEPKSIAIQKVIFRLGVVIEDFNKERQDDAKILIGLRNKELHTGEDALPTDSSMWLPRFMRVVTAICAHLDLNPVELLGEDVVKQGQALVDEEDKKLTNAVRTRIAESREFFERLQEDEVKARRATIPFLFGEPTRGVTCPACNSDAIQRVDDVRRTNERLEDGVIYRDIVYVAQDLECTVCGLRLASTAEIKCAGLRQQYSGFKRETLEDRFLDSYEPDDYDDDR